MNYEFLKSLTLNRWADDELDEPIGKSLPKRDPHVLVVTSKERNLVIIVSRNALGDDQKKYWQRTVRDNTPQIVARGARIEYSHDLIDFEFVGYFWKEYCDCEEEKMKAYSMTLPQQHE